MTTPTTTQRFAEEPIVSDSAQFPLARPLHTPEAADAPSPEGIRAWGLRGMQTPPPSGVRLPVWRFDHERQVAVDDDGRPLREVRMGDPTANSVSNNDGDEGVSEDWVNDFAPDAPFPPA